MFSMLSKTVLIIKEKIMIKQPMNPPEVSKAMSKVVKPCHDTTKLSAVRE